MAWKSRLITRRTEILHGVESNASGRGGDDRIQEKTDSHQGRRDNHSPFTPKARYLDESGTKQDTRDANYGDDDAMV